MQHNCDEEELHSARIKTALSEMPSAEMLAEMGARFKTISEPSRLKILFALSVGELCVEHIVEAVGGNQSAVSHQLRILRDNRMIKSRREGQNILYSLADAHVLAVLELALAHAGCEGGEE